MSRRPICLGFSYSCYSCIRSVCNYAISVFHSSLPQYPIDELEREQKRALSIICPTLSYDNALASLQLDLEVFLVVHHKRLCQSLSEKISKTENIVVTARLYPTLLTNSCFIVYCLLFIVLFAINCTNQIKSNYLNSHGEEAQEKPPGL